jgi:hypothetical protein
MIHLQRITGMRPCEVELMRACDIDSSQPVWVDEPHTHKNRWRGNLLLPKLAKAGIQRLQKSLRNCKITIQ